MQSTQRTKSFFSWVRVQEKTLRQLLHVLILYTSFYVLRTLHGILVSLAVMPLISSTLRLTHSRRKTYSLKALRQRLSGRLGSLESFMPRLNPSNLTNLSQYILDTRKESLTRGLILSWQYLMRSLDLLLKLEQEMTRVKQQTISIKHSEPQSIHVSQI